MELRDSAVTDSDGHAAARLLGASQRGDKTSAPRQIKAGRGSKITISRSVVTVSVLSSILVLVLLET